MKNVFPLREIDGEQVGTRFEAVRNAEVLCETLFGSSRARGGRLAGGSGAGWITSAQPRRGPNPAFSRPGWGMERARAEKSPHGAGF